MKKLMLLMGLLMMSYAGYSQVLSPKTQQISGKKHYCFTIKQSRDIAKLIELGRYNDSIVTNLSQNVRRYQLLTQKKDDIISLQQHRLKNYKTIVDNNDRNIMLLEENLKRKDKKIKKNKLQKTLLFISLVGLGIFTVSK